MNTRQRERGTLANTIVIYSSECKVFRMVFSSKEAINTIKHLTYLYNVQFKVTTIKEYLK